MSDESMSGRERAETMLEEEPLRYASEASDYGWSVLTGMCGGCGSDKCHNGPCDGEHCQRCPDRVLDGFAPPSSSTFSLPGTHEATE